MAEKEKIIKQFEKDLEKTIVSYLNYKNNILKDGNGIIYEIKNVVRDSLSLSTRNQYKLDQLVTYLQTPTNTQPNIEGYISLNIKCDKEENYSRRVYFFEIYATSYQLKHKANLNASKSKCFDITLSQVEYFMEQKYFLY